MQINLTNGQARVKLFKAEIAALRKARDILDGIGKFDSDVSGDLISDVLLCVDSGGVYDADTYPGPGRPVQANLSPAEGK